MRGRGFTPTVLMALATRGYVITKPETMSPASFMRLVENQRAARYSTPRVASLWARRRSFRFLLMRSRFSS